MTCDALWQMDATALSQAFSRGEMDPVDALEACLARMDLLEPMLNAYSCRGPEARGEAERAARRWREGRALSPLDGVPVIVKDNLCAAGMAASWGNRVLAGRVCAGDEAPVQRLRSGGIIVVGKGNTPEFAVEGYTGNQTFGATGNPFAPGLTPGGSSGGVVAAVAAGMAFAGLATDGGGSIRRPAGYTGLFGLKPGIGHIHRAGGLAQLLLDFEVVGPVARSLRDLRALDALLSGKAPETVRPGPRRILAVAAISDHRYDVGIASVFEQCVSELEAAGHTVTPGPLPVDLEPLNAVWGSIAEIGLARLFAADPEVAASAAPKYREMAQRGQSYDAAYLYDVLIRVYALREATRDLWGYDAVLMPTSAAYPWPADQAYPPQINGHDVGPRGHAVYTGWVNAAGLPAVAFPASVPEGLPVGVQLIGRMGSEASLMAIAEGVAPPFRWPDLALSAG